MTSQQRLWLVLRVRLHEPRYHGQPEWPPAPARLFQALVAGAAARGGPSAASMEALRWLETLPPPIIAAPFHSMGQPCRLYVPNNDLDAKDGDPERVNEIRAAKGVWPRLLDSDLGFLFAWSFDASRRADAENISELSLGLYQFGRGFDMAWATSEILDHDELRTRLEEHAGEVFRPGSHLGKARILACPGPGSLRRLSERFQESRARFRTYGEGSERVHVFAQPAMPSFVQVPYGGHSARCAFDLQTPEDMGRRAAWPLGRAHDLVVLVRDGVARRLGSAFTQDSVRVEAAIVGAGPAEEVVVPAELRTRIVPLPSIGHQHSDHQIRRVLVEVPLGGPLDPDDVFWGFSGLVVSDDSNVVLVRSQEDRMLSHYAVGEAKWRRWMSVTPVALPERASRRRIDPDPRARDQKRAEERAAEEARARAAVGQALRHAGVRSKLWAVHVQREPFGSHGLRAEAFGQGTRFAKERLWHVALELAEAIEGPLVIGDGRFLGLGVLAPVRDDAGVLALSVVEGLSCAWNAEEIARALQRALMSRYQQLVGRSRRIPSFLSGHGPKGEPARDEARLHFAFDPTRGRLLVISPNRPGPKHEQIRDVMQAMERLTELRAGRSGLLRLRPATVAPNTDPLFAPSLSWSTVTPYVLNRHLHLKDAAEAVAEDVRASCRAHLLPEPIAIEVSRVRSEARNGVRAEVTLRFATAVNGPMLLGRTRHRGGGLFEGGG